MHPASAIPTPEKLERLRELTTAYASFSRGAVGLGSLLGGAIAMAVCLVGAFAEPSLQTRAMLGLALPVWFASKAWLRSHHYQRRGVATPNMDATAVAIESFSQGGTGGISLIILLTCLFLLVIGAPKIAALPLLNKVALLISPATGLLWWRRVNTPFEMLVAVNLLVQTVILVSGSAFGWPQQRSMFLWAALLAGIGAYEHFRFRQVEAELRTLQGRP